MTRDDGDDGDPGVPDPTIAQPIAPRVDDKQVPENASQGVGESSSEQLDLTAERPVGNKGPLLRKAPALSPPDTKSFALDAFKQTLEERQERMRGVIALGLLLLLTSVVWLSMYVACYRHADLSGDQTAARMTQLEGLLKLLYPPLIALVSAATGFYFGGGKK